MFSLRKAAGIFLCATMLLSVQAGPVLAKEEHFLDYSEDNFKVAFISGNLTAAVTHDWPRIVFEHSTDPFSPTFEVGFPRMFLYNDSNADDYFAMSELTYVAYLDENHVLWNVTPVEFHNDSVTGEYASFRMNATVALYQGLSNVTAAIHDWANVTFWFRISQRNSYNTNSLGSYLVRGRTDLTFNFTIDVLKPVKTTGIVMESLLSGGGSTYMFIIRQQGIHHSVVDEFVSARVDESVFGANFTHGFSETTLPDQEISFAKDDRLVQAYYRWDSEPTINVSDNTSVPTMHDSYFTTGTGMMMHKSYVIGNETGRIYQEAFIGIDETAFIGKITNWLRDNINLVIAFTGGMAALIVLSAFTLTRIRRRATAKADPSPSDDKK